MSEMEPLHVAIGTVRLELRRHGDDPDDVDAQRALGVLDELRCAEPELAASQWYANAGSDQIASFVQEWKGAP